MSYNPNDLFLNSDDLMLECNSGQTGFDFTGTFVVFDSVTNPGGLAVTNTSATNGLVQVPPGLYQGSWEIDFDNPPVGTSILAHASISSGMDLRQYVVPASHALKAVAGQGVYRVEDTGIIGGLAVQVEGDATVDVAYAFLKLRPLTPH